MTLYGPDGSHWQKGIQLSGADWAAADFVIWRCVTERGELDDTWRWAQAQAEAHRKPFLAYCFLSTDPRQLDEAVVAAIQDQTVPVMCDWEKMGCTFDEMMTWVTDVRAKGYRVPLLYTGKGFWQANGSPTLTGLGMDLVVARYGDQNPTAVYEYRPRYADMNRRYGSSTWPGFGGLPATFWQYGSRIRWGNLPMDYNAFEGTVDELGQWFKMWESTAGTPDVPPPTPPAEEIDVAARPAMCIVANDGKNNGSQNIQFAYDGEAINVIPNGPARDAGIWLGWWQYDPNTVTAGDAMSGKPYNNFSFGEIQQIINTCWRGVGPPPSPYRAPS